MVYPPKLYTLLRQGFLTGVKTMKHTNMLGIPSWMKLTKFQSDYIATALWSSVDDNDDPLDRNYDIDDINLDSLNIMLADCNDFEKSFGDIATETDHPGHDFWLTRNGHGAGFWDGDYPIHGDYLTEMSKAYGSCDLYVGDDDSLYLYA